MTAPKRLWPTLLALGLLSVSSVACTFNPGPAKGEIVAGGGSAGNGGSGVVPGTGGVPVGNGKATITATHGGRSAAAKVTVVDLGKPSDHSFRNHIQPILARFGCSSGACHGAAAGKSGFKLSLRGYDDDGDYAQMTRHALGRRINLVEPGRSLLLMKPTGAVAHKGGLRFGTDSREYAVLSEWIAAGAPGPKKSDPIIDRIEIVYHLSSLKHRHWIVLKVHLPRVDPKIPTVETIWPAAPDPTQGLGATAR